MRERIKQSPPSPNASVRVSLRDIYECLCPDCRNAMLDLLTNKAEASGVREILQRQLESKSNDS